MPVKVLSMIACAVACAATLPASADPDAPPPEAAALRQFLGNGGYLQWAKESRAHPSAGPHPVTVRTYLNPALEASLAAGNPQHPVGAAAVKELFGDDGKLSGWAVSIKTEPRSGVGKGWYWYEVTSTARDAQPVAAGHGVPLCANCHAPGNDFVLGAFPLR
jgi:hypothetical protein